jgi:hypothetical protein
MQVIDTHGTFEQAIAEGDSELQVIAGQLRGLIEQVYPRAFEVAWPKQRIIGYGVGPKKMTEHFCYVGLHAKHVNLGFYYGASLDDLQGVMEGTGENMRHVKVRNLAEASAPALRRLVELAVEERQAALNLSS